MGVIRTSYESLQFWIEFLWFHPRISCKKLILGHSPNHRRFFWGASLKVFELGESCRGSSLNLDCSGTAYFYRYFSEDVNKDLESFHWRNFAFENTILWKFDSDQCFWKNWLFDKLMIFLLSSIHEFRIFVFFQKFPHILNIHELFLIFSLYFLLKLTIKLFLKLGFHLIDPNFPIMNRLRHNPDSFFF